jgi:hypothetical protein
VGSSFSFSWATYVVAFLGGNEGMQGISNNSGRTNAVGLIMSV